ncbi:MAG: Holliday junction resolvase RuvX [Alphaproteobacteria bacterium]|nr:Holliday junction resolvase RuvX [Alphaproteobacteria bacterium]
MEFAKKLPGKGALIGIDYGQVNCGLAVSDENRIIASAMKTVKQKDLKKEIDSLSAGRNICGLVVGLPVEIGGREGPMAAKVRGYVEKNIEILGLPILFCDERYTSVIAQRTLINIGDVPRGKRKQAIDKLAAVVILQGVLDSLAKIKTQS